MPSEEIPDARSPYPVAGHPRVAFLKNHITRPNIIVGDYTYYDDPEGVAAFERNVLYHFEFTGDRLVIGKFCAIATGTKFVMNGGHHNLAALSSYPFLIFGGAWAENMPAGYEFPMRGDTIIGNDVWLGYDSLIMPGVTIGDGAVVGARAVVTRDVAPYQVVAGNPARVVRSRFDEATIAALLEIRWWDWDIGKITRNLPAICGTDLQQLRAAGRGPL